MTEADALDTLKAGDAMRAAGDLDGAERTLRALVEGGHVPGWASFMLGRVLRDADRPREAVACFEASLAEGGPPFWARYERLVLMRWWEEAAFDADQSIAELLAAPPEPLGMDHLRELEAVAQVAWDRGSVRSGRALLERVAEAGGLSPLGLRRLGRAVDPAVEAARLVARAEIPVLPAHRLVLERRRLRAPEDAETWLALVMLEAQLGRDEAVAALLEEADGFPRIARSLARLVAAVEAGGTGGAGPAHLRLLDLARLHGTVPRRLALLASERLAPVARAEVLALVDAAHPNDPEVGRARAWARMEEGDWVGAGAVLDAAFPDGPDQGPIARAIHADLLAVQGRLADASALLEAGRTDGVIPPDLLPSELRILGEQGRWDAVLDAMIAAPSAEDRFDAVLAPAVRAARRTGRVAELFEHLIALPERGGILGQGSGRALAALAEALGGPNAVARAAAAGVPDDLLVRARRSSAASTSDRDLCIFLCADRGYLEPALVSLASLASSNAGLLMRADVHLVAAPDISAEARATGAALAGALRFELTVVDGGTLSAGRAAYGMFTGGEALAGAAYWRIGHARFLAAAARYRTAIYLDADTLVRAGLAALADLATDAPLLARPEPDRGAVRRAARLHGLRGRYFNSGVLRFALDHPETLPALDRALSAATDPAVPLLFHDQCALNIGFDGLAGELPPPFNHYVRPDRRDDGSTQDAVVVHYLDRPKPWDPLYPEPAREWYGWVELVHRLAESAALDR